MRKIVVDIYSSGSSNGYFDEGERLGLYSASEDIKQELQRHLKVHEGQFIRRESRLTFIMEEDDPS